MARQHVFALVVAWITIVISKVSVCTFHENLVVKLALADLKLAVAERASTESPSVVKRVWDSEKFHVGATRIRGGQGNEVTSEGSDSDAKMQIAVDVLSPTVTVDPSNLLGSPLPMSNELPPGNIVFIRGLTIAGLSVAQDAKPFFLRPEARDLWKALNEIRRSLRVTGGPGTGKSSVVWLWLCYQALVSKKKCLWIHMRSTLNPVVVEFKNGSTFKSKMTMNQIGDLLRKSDAHVVVVDGLVSKNPAHQKLQTFLFNLADNTDATFISVSSMSTEGSVRMIEEYAETGIGHFEMSVWTLKQLKEACEHKDFFLSVASALGCGSETKTKIESMNTMTRQTIAEIHSVVENKYFFAGGSARWMFQMSIDEVRKSVAKHLQRVGNMDDLFAKSVGTVDETATNTLLSRVYDNIHDVEVKFFASQYVARCVFRQCGHEAVRSAYELGALHKNPAFSGWAAEFDFVSQLEDAAVEYRMEDRCIKLFREGKPEQNVEVPGFAEFVALEPAPRIEALQNSWWLRPSLWNEAGYDLLRLETRRHGFFGRPRRVLWFFQVSRADVHAVDLNHFLPVTERIEALLGVRIEGIEISILSPCLRGQRVWHKPRIKIENPGKLTRFFVREGPAKWVNGNESEAISFLGFSPLSILGVKVAAGGRKQ